MKFLVVGLGSMGKRRIRNLMALGYDAGSIAGFDIRLERCAEAESLFSISSFENFNNAIQSFSPQAIIISTDPSCHMDYAEQAFGIGLHCFIEASVTELERIKKLCNKLNDNCAVIIPSNTMRYYPGPSLVREIIEKELIGKPLSLNYHTGQYLPDWHPWENIEDFYVSRRETGGAREIVPFELAWINEIFGNPEPLCAIKDKLADFEADIDDIYCCLLRYPSGMIASITIDVISRPKATRYLTILGSEGKIIFDGDKNSVRYINTDMSDWIETFFDSGTIEEDYINPEEPYIAELRDFITAIDKVDRKIFPNSLEKDIEVLSLLNRLEMMNVY
ncbi:Gfo/Idh/MocA family oxidoreductase [Alphaproteobacteria bacterium]|nr:Gfo/Idh/MocA family oxidoreductase [Alphaproteobacteria bacterium]